jgi:hypothetical protein
MRRPRELFGLSGLFRVSFLLYSMHQSPHHRDLQRRTGHKRPAAVANPVDPTVNTGHIVCFVIHFIFTRGHASGARPLERALVG